MVSPSKAKVNSGDTYSLLVSGTSIDLFDWHYNSYTTRLDVSLFLT